MQRVYNRLITVDQASQIIHKRKMKEFSLPLNVNKELQEKHL